MFVAVSVWRKEGSLCNIEKPLVWINKTINIYPSPDRQVMSDSARVCMYMIEQDFQSDDQITTSLDIITALANLLFNTIGFIIGLIWSPILNLPKSMF